MYLFLIPAKSWIGVALTMRVTAAAAAIFLLCTLGVSYAQNATCSKQGSVEDIEIFLTDLHDGNIPGALADFDDAFDVLGRFELFNMVTVFEVVGKKSAYISEDGLTNSTNLCRITEQVATAAIVVEGKRKLRRLAQSISSQASSSFTICLPIFNCTSFEGTQVVSLELSSDEVPAQPKRNLAVTLCVAECCVSFALNEQYAKDFSDLLDECPEMI